MDELFGESSTKDSAALLIARIETLERREAQSAGAAMALAERVETLERKNAELETTVRVRRRPLSRCARPVVTPRLVLLWLQALRQVGMLRVGPDTVSARPR